MIFLSASPFSTKNCGGKPARRIIVSLRAPYIGTPLSSTPGTGAVGSETCLSPVLRTAAPGIRGASVPVIRSSVSLTFRNLATGSARDKLPNGDCVGSGAAAVSGVQSSASGFLPIPAAGFPSRDDPNDRPTAAPGVCASAGRHTTLTGIRTVSGPIYGTGSPGNTRSAGMTTVSNERLASESDIGEPHEMSFRLTDYVRNGKRRNNRRRCPAARDAL